MSLAAISSNASSGIADIASALAVVGQNVANANTVGWTREVATHESVTAEGVGMGVRSGPIGRATQPQMQAAALTQSATVAGAQVRSDALAGIDAAQGTTGGNDDLGSLLGAVQDRFVALAQDPSSATGQAAVVAAATTFAAKVNAVAGAVGQARQAAQDDAVVQVAALNTSLAQVGKLSHHIVVARASGQNTADLENQRDAVVAAVAKIVPVRAATSANGTFVLISGGIPLPTDQAAPFTLASAAIGPQVAYPGVVPAVMLGHADVTGQLGGGTLGADITLRDVTLPAAQAGLDQFAQTIGIRFQQQGLRLFTNASGGVPQSVALPTQSGYLGFAGIMQVNPAVVAAPSLVRDGTDTIAGSVTGASAFTINPPGGPVGSTTLISRILRQTFGTELQPGVAQSNPATTGLGANGNLTLPYSPPGTLGLFASSLVGSMSADTAQASSDSKDAQALGATLDTKLQAAGGVSIDTEMSTMVTLQNAYAANAKVLGAVQSAWADLLATVNR